MDRLAIIGVSHSSGGTAKLEAWQARHPGHRAVAGLGFDEAVVIATCNRFEAVVALPFGMSCEAARTLLAPASTAERANRAYVYRGEAALEHLIRVAASLDSLNPGEDQIMRQVRAAFSTAQQAGTTGSRTDFAFNSALRAAKRVRREVPLSPVEVSVFGLAWPYVRDHLAPGTSVAVIGAGEMGGLAARGLARSGLGIEIVIVNRDPERGRTLAGLVGGRWLPLDEFLASPPAITGLVCATPSGGLVDERMLAKLPDLAVVLDLGMPRNVAAGSIDRARVALFDIDSLRVAGQRRREAIGARLAEAEQLVREEVSAALDAWTDRQLAPSIRRLRQLYRDTIGDGLPAEEAERLAHRFAHVPVKGLRALARRYGVEAATTFLAETEPAAVGLMTDEQRVAS